jgi:ribonuclease BN (tRNA processing enzyme)
MRFHIHILPALLCNTAVEDLAGQRPGHCADSKGPILPGADVLVMHMPVPENIGGVGRNLHAPPSVIGKIAAETGTGKRVLGHFMARSLENREENLDQIRSQFGGSVVVAEDLKCVTF